MQLRIAVVGVLLLSVFMLTSGVVDLDWMLTANHFQMWNAAKDTWEFSPYLTMNWWAAYVFSLLRAVCGAIGLGAVTAYILWVQVNKKNASNMG